MSTDTDIERVAEKMRRLPPHSSERVNPPRSIEWGPPLPGSRVAGYEAAHGIRLPADYRAFITRVAGSGSHPFYGLEELGVPNGEFGEDDVNPGRPFPFTPDQPWTVGRCSERTPKTPMPVTQLLRRSSKAAAPRAASSTCATRAAA